MLFLYIYSVEEDQREREERISREEERRAMEENERRESLKQGESLDLKIEGATLSPGNKQKVSICSMAMVCIYLMQTENL